MNEINSQKQNIKDTILRRIEAEKIAPRSRIYWLAHESSLWVVWLVTVIIGAFALAILSFSSVYMGYSLYEATHENFFTFMMETLPYLWFLAFVLMIFAAQYQLRHTKKGYKYPVILVIGSSFGFSIIGGIFLHYIGAGFYMDKVLGETLSAYQSRAEFEELIWQNPEAGRLIGRATTTQQEISIPGVVFVDIEDKQWQVLADDLRVREKELLNSGQKVRILVATSSDQLKDVFVVCGVFPWMLDDVPVVAKWREDRREFVDNVKERRAKIIGIVKELKQNEADTEEPMLLPNGEMVATGSAIALNTVSGDPTPCSHLSLFRAR